MTSYEAHHRGKIYVNSYSSPLQDPSSIEPQSHTTIISSSIRNPLASAPKLSYSPLLMMSQPEPYTRRSFHSPSAPAPNGNYSHAILQQSPATLHIAGWMGDDPSTGKIVEGGIGAQTVRSSQISCFIFQQSIFFFIPIANTNLKGSLHS